MTHQEKDRQTNLQLNLGQAQPTTRQSTAFCFTKQPAVFGQNTCPTRWAQSSERTTLLETS